MEQVRRTSLADQAARLLFERIRAGEWHLGAKLPGETTLGPQLGVGRSTVREAIRQLAGRGVLETRQGAGVFVTALDVNEDWDRVLRQADIAAVIEGRIAIETEAASLAAQRRTATDIRAMRRALAQRVTAGQSAEKYVDADMALHRTVVAAAHNKVLLELFDGFVPRVRQAMIDMLGLQPAGTPCDSDAAGNDQQAHAELVQAVIDRQSATAAQLSRTHLTSLKAALV
ncbi:FadR/GntR family transcriptional regulator [Micromonospora sp. HUAS LYJ1]|uniref:FadR/GntR family transcriptional regulator n=1 Tax=Micromonospora sp. HUAS LYJ1 TaxID=3061626 RepID=UPI00267403AC|nr:FCD domain-containing protein [Micromonospora sp. HUAS LYJ1]WKU05455.1 FCD domain-containing protein [Micromonospora sp. HUAS LYJ1]